MFLMKNGILYRDNKAVFGLGVSYYASYHEKKVPVPKDGDRIGEMKKDLRGMCKSGFNIVRMASIGEVKREDSDVKINTELIDVILDEADKLDIATMIRLQGYSMNLSGYKDFYMINSHGGEMDKTIWFDFIQNSLHHKGIIKDNSDGTAALAKHYAKHKNLVSFQTYNEPHYPSYEVFDYHPDAIAAYRKWCVQKGILSPDEAKDYQPPKQRPQKDEDPKPWIYWRLFAIESLSNFLNNSAMVAKQADKTIESLTCLTTSSITLWNAELGVSYFDNARGMDTVGITHYINTCGAPYFEACLALDNAESAAALNNKHCWLVEYDARTNIPMRKFYEETYMAVGAGIKGIMYYQWRGDYRFPDSPEGNGFGFINDDGSQTEFYEEKMQVIQLLNNLSDYIVNAEKKRCGVAILHSNYGFCHADAAENGKVVRRNRFLETYKSLYKQLRENGITVDLVECRDLAENVLNIKTLYVPCYDLLPEYEQAQIKEFMDNGGHVYISENGFNCAEIGKVYDKDHSQYNISDILETEHITPVIQSDNRSIMVQAIYGDGYIVASVNNISINERIKNNVCMKLNTIHAKKIVFYTPGNSQEISVNNDEFIIPEIKEGGLLLITQ